MKPGDLVKVVDHATLWDVPANVTPASITARLKENDIALVVATTAYIAPSTEHSVSEVWLFSARGVGWVMDSAVGSLEAVTRVLVKA